MHKKSLAELSIDLDAIADENIRVIIKHLLNIIESQAGEIDDLRKENQKLRDENNQLKGEQGKPTFRKQTQKNKDISSEKERKEGESKPRKKKPKKKSDLTVHKTERCKLDRQQLPEDVVFKGYQSTIIQDIIISPHNIQFDKEIYYSPSLKKTFIASLPDGYRGDFGPTIRALILDMHYHKEMTESSIHAFLTTHGIEISSASISRLLTDNHESFHQEKKAIVSAGLRSTLYQQMDDTGGRVKGKNHVVHIVCNEYYTAYFTKESKARLTIIDILTQGEMKFHFNEKAYALMKHMQLSEKMLAAIKAKNPAPVMNRFELDELLKELLPVASKQKTNRQIILEASAITGYQSRADAVKLLLTDDAPQFKQSTELLALCWVHDGRHYKKLSPVVPLH